VVEHGIQHQLLPVRLARSTRRRQRGHYAEGRQPAPVFARAPPAPDRLGLVSELNVKGARLVVTGNRLAFFD